ncbi:MAG: N-6 DNA methylase [Thermoplasmata archaeon]|nr:N-6 DNA methylase [Thermoplasmata archaeon]
MPAPPELKTLVKRYEDNHKQYSSAAYKEAELRKEFLNPLFELLGWDIYNKKGRPEQYKEVVDEPSLEVEGGTKAPDYAFRLGEVTKFYVEAKKPSVKITTDPLPAFQLKRYAWSAKLPLSILTNFEDISVYDCRFKPEKFDNATKGRILHIDYQDLEEKWDELANIFSPDAIWQGSFDKYIDKKKRGTSEVDTEILREIEGWREELAKNIAIRNPDLSIEEMNFAVQRLIDRILFLRICEDRGTEKENQLVDMLERGTDLYKHLFVIFQQADTKYNSGLFHLQYDKKRKTKIDRITPFIKVDDKVIASIIWDLYYPRSPYQFDVIPADILGHVYEQFLGKVIRLTAGHRAKVEEKPEVKKAGGVYYTPTYIVDYIVKNTVVKLCENKSLEEMASIKILDPACGSGSFLIVAYKKMLDEHLKWYEANKPKKHKDQVFKNQKGAWQLTLREKKRILLNNIHGVDIDSQAVEVTKLNLMLKALEGESMESINNISKWFGEPALPDLGTNIKCGNSLIDFDIIDHLQDLDNEERDNELARINPFSWEAEFPDIMKAGGFDAVVGNPPWGAKIVKAEKIYFESVFNINLQNINTFELFILKGLTIQKKDGILGIIVPRNFIRQSMYSSTRNLLLRKSKIEEIIDFKKFPGVTQEFVGIFISKPSSDKLLANNTIKLNNNNYIQQTIFLKMYNNVFNLSLTNDVFHILEKIMNNSKPLDHFVHIIRGEEISKKGGIIQCNNCEKWHVASKKAEIKCKYCGTVIVINKANIDELISNEKTDDHNSKIVTGEDITNYNLTNFHYFNPNKDGIKLKNLEYYKSPKIVMRAVDNNNSTLDLEEDIFVTKNVYSIRAKNDNSILPYILCIMNSKLFDFYNANVFTLDASMTIFFSKSFLVTLPIKEGTNKQKDDLSGYCYKMLDLHQKLNNALLPTEEIILQRQIYALDNQINRLVYQLYGLTEEEIDIVEGVA